MCGIYGFIGDQKAKKKVLEIFESLAVETEVRGIHATGYYGLTEEGVVTEKAPLRASLFLKTQDYKKLYQNPPTLLIGHNRWATHGDPQQNENNHPFTTGRFGFIHNGVVGRVQPDMEITTRSECDSEKMFRYFLKRFYNDHDHFVSLEKTMKCFDVDGDFACALVDSKDKELYLFRNSARPIVYLYLEEFETIFFASTAEIMKSSLVMNNIKFDSNKIYSLKTGQILKITEQLNKQFKIVKEIKPPVKYTYVPNIKFPASTTNIKYYKPTKKPKLVGWGCKICNRVFVKPEYTKQHIIDAHKITDLEQIADKVQHTVTNAKVSFTTKVGDKIIKSGDFFNLTPTDCGKDSKFEQLKLSYSWSKF